MKAERPTVLVIDDSSVDREQVRRLLGRGFEVLEAETAAAGVLEAEQARPACVLLDHRLPDAEGLDVLAELNSFPVVLMTGHGSTEVAVEALKRGACDFLAKADLSAQLLQRAVTGAITRRDLERRLQSAERLEALGRLAGGVAHDFNNMLMAILGRVELALLNANPEVERHLETIRLAATRSTELTQRLLAFGRKLDLQAKELDVSKVVEEVASLVHSAVGEQIDVRFELEAGRGVVARFDPGLLQQALINLALNARDAMKPGDHLTISVGPLTPEDRSPPAPGHENEYVRIAVSDTGHGMPEEVRARAFEPFFTTKAEGVGSGLGLAGVHGFVHQSGGEIAIMSTAGKGTTVAIYLPRVEEGSQVAANQPHAQGLAEGLAEGIASLDRQRILVVEDEPLVRALLVEVLSRADYDVIEVSTTDEAIRCADEQPGSLGLVLSDVVLPSGNGPEAVTRILATQPQAKVIYISGYSADRCPKEAVQRAAAFLPKPVRPKALLSAVRSALGG